MSERDSAAARRDAAALRKLVSEEPRSPDDIEMGRASSGLWLPAHLLVERPEEGQGAKPAARPAILRFAAKTFGWSEAVGKRVALDEVLQLLRAYSIREVVAMVARISVALQFEGEDVLAPPAGVPDTPRFRVQYLIAERLANAAVAQWLVRQVRAKRGGEFDPERTVFFQERQALNALKLALLVTDVGTRDGNAGTLPFFKALLMLSDHLDPEGGTLGGSDPEKRDALELYVAANTLFNEHSNRLHEFVRSYELFVAPKPELAGQNVIDVPTALERSTGMDARTTWNALYAIYVNWGVQTLADLDKGNIGIRRSLYLEHLTKLPAVLRERWFELAAWDAAELQQRVRGRYSEREPRWFDVLPFEERPLVAFGDELFCISLRLLERLPGRSLQHRLLDDGAFDKKERRRFLDTRGALVERYTVDALRRAFGTQLVTEAELQALAPGESVCDAVVLYEDAVVLVECKTFSVLLDTRHATDYASYRAKWAEAMRKAATQLESTLALIRSGAFAGLGLRPEMAREAYPVVGVFEQPVTPLTYRAIRERDLAGHPLEVRMRRGEVRHLQLLHISEVEMVEAAVEQGHSLLALLREKTTDADTVDIAFHHFAHLREKSFTNGHTRWQEARWQEIADGVSERARAWGLPEGEDA